MQRRALAMEELLESMYGSVLEASPAARRRTLPTRVHGDGGHRVRGDDYTLDVKQQDVVMRRQRRVRTGTVPSASSSPEPSQELEPHLPHGRALRRRLEGARQLSAALEGFGTAAWIVDRQGVVQFANEAADRITSTPRSFIGIRHRCLLPAWPADRRALSSAVRDAARKEGGRASRMPLRDRHGTTAASCTIRPLPVAAPCWMLPSEPQALVVVLPATLRRYVAVELLRQAWGLTHAESVLAQALLRHGSLTTCVNALGKAHETLRSQLKSIFAKTGTNRQADLLAKLLDLSE